MEEPAHDQKAEVTDEFLIPITIIEFDFSATEFYGRLRAHLESIGTPIGAGHAHRRSRR